ncbi:MFS general substrate transporter [Linderina pennispora]|uniref:MFS general substrate transporter n=1 Tax=Linderina pennispora TaxID=61395 RepID=A0A1Y1W1F0_9FUNG|nr:MFS general substrate transporter [Linderina pennispora]ORX67331.1 MFS general substrate transporter [Linderina pennispora]
MDRSSMGNAKVANMEKDLHLRPTDFSIASSLFYPTYLVFQPLSNYMLKRVGARTWLPLLTLLWGAVIIGQAFITNRGQLFLCRVLLGIPEAGYNSGAIYLISYWYPRKRVTRRVSIFYTGTAIGTLISGPIAIGLTKLNSGFVKSWHAIFFVEGVITCAWAVVMYFVVPSYPDDAKILTSDEREALSQALNEEKQESGRHQINKRRFIMCLFNPSMLLMSLILFCSNVSLNTIMLRCPASAASSALYWFNWHVRWFGSHYRAIIFNGAVMALGGIIMLATLNVGARMFALCLFGFGSFGLLGLAPGWLATNVASNITLGSAATSVLLICGGLGGIVASNIYRNKDAPRYLLGHGINLMAGLLSIVLALLARWNMGRINRNKELSPIDISNMTQKEIQELEERHPDFRYVY